jgi:hypothetical protein
VDDYLAVCAAMGLAGCSGTIDSGGEPVEAAALAAMVSKVVRDSSVIRGDIDPLVPANIYMSDNHSWVQATQALGFEAGGLAEQVARTSSKLEP